MIAVALAALTGCAANYRETTHAQSDGKLSRQARVYVAVPADGRYGSTTYEGSGQTVAQMVRGAMLRRVARVDAGRQAEDTDAAMASARALGADLAVVPVISHWEDRATEWSGKPDKAEVVISVYEVRTGQLRDRATIGGNSSFWTLGGDRPEDILPKPLGEYVSTLF